MKKIIVFLISVLLCFSSMNAQSLMESLNGFSKTKIATGTIPEGREILPAVYQYVKGYTVADGNFGECKFLALDPINNFFRINQYIIYKSGLGYSKQLSTFEVTCEGNIFTVNALGMTNTTVNKNGKAIGPSRDASNSSISKLNEITVEQILSLLSTDDETWNNMVDMTYADINIIITSVNGAANKIKAKQYLKNHPVEGKNTDFKFIFQNVDESNIEGYAYKFTGMYNCPFTKEASPVFIIFYSNNDEYVEQKNGTSILAKGTINNIGTDELIGFSISSITIFE